jgi:hypothetical protein
VKKTDETKTTAAADVAAKAGKGSELTSNLAKKLPKSSRAREHEAGEGASRKGLEHFRAAGEALIKAKKQCGHGKFGEWLKANVRCDHSQACRYMKLAREWSIIGAAPNMAAALRVLAEDADEPPHHTPNSDMIEAFTSKILGQMFYIRQDLGGIERLASERDKWDWDQIREGTLPKLRERPMTKKAANELAPGDRFEKAPGDVCTVLSVRHACPDRGGPWLQVKVSRPDAHATGGSRDWYVRLRPATVVRVFGPDEVLSDRAAPTRRKGDLIHVRTWAMSGSARIVCMANAGLRGKRCRVLRLSGWLVSAPMSDEARLASDWTRRLLDLIDKLGPADPFEMARDRLLELLEQARAEGVRSGVLDLYDETIRGVDAPRPRLTAGVAGVWSASADEDGVCLRSLNDPNEWTEITHDQTGAAAYAAAAKVWEQMQHAKTRREASDMLHAAGCRLHGFCAMD